MMSQPVFTKNFNTHIDQKIMNYTQPDNHISFLKKLYVR